MDLGMMAIHSVDLEKILNYINDFYSVHGLTLVEERIGTRSGQFLNSPKQYKDIVDYDNQIDAEYHNKQLRFSTNFDFFGNLKENDKWVAFQYYPRKAELTVSIDRNLADYVSDKLGVDVIELFENDTANQIIIRGHLNGYVKDEFATGEMEVYSTSGFFEKYELRGYDNMEDICAMRDSYFKSIEFNQYSQDFNQKNNPSRRPMYLKGAPEKIISFLEKQQVF